MTHLSLLDELQQRGLYYQVTNEACFEQFQQWNHKFYIGYDPTADSLTIGNFATIMTALQFMKRGNKFVVIIGGATGMIGDPSGKDSERNFLDEAQLLHNQKAIHTQITKIFANITALTGWQLKFEVINNYDFYKNMGTLDFLRTVGKYITVNSMLSKDSISNRLTDGNFISYTEFSYTLLQGYDFVKLHQEHDVTLQIGASDQRGNITTGTELIRKITGQEGYGFTFPLILDSTGKKFGKSEGNAIRLDSKKNSPYVCYQYFMNVSDDDVTRYLKIFSVLSLEAIQEIVATHAQDPSKRYGQQRLAYLVTEIIFGTPAADDCAVIRECLFGNDDNCSVVWSLNLNQLKILTDQIWSVIAFPDNFLLDILIDSWLYNSRKIAKIDIKNKAISINGTIIDDINYQIKKEDMLANKVILLRKGKKHNKIIYVVD
jgi:tyrosyl-tRNA synthetase